MTECRKELQAVGLPYPRTCPTCGLGPCRKHPDVQTHHPVPLATAETERLALLAEECGEVVQIIGKILRHGYSSYHPNNHQVDNRQMLEEELGDLDAAILLLVQRGDISLDRVNKASLSKQDRGSRYLHHNHWDLPPCDP